MSQETQASAEDAVLEKEIFKSYIVFYSKKYGSLRIVYRDERFMFLITDICKALGYKIITYVLDKVDDNQKSIVDFYYCDQYDKPQFFHAITLEGLHSVINTSDKENAQEYLGYITNEIVPVLKEKEGEICNQIFNSNILWINSFEDIQFYKNKKFDRIRFTQYKGEILFVATDVAKAVGHMNLNRAIYTHCTDIRFACIQISKIDTTGFIKKEDVVDMPENFYPDIALNDDGIAEDESFTSPAEVRGLKLIPLHDVCRLISRSQTSTSTALLDAIVSEFMSRQCFTFSVADKRKETEDSGISAEEGSSIHDGLKTEKAEKQEKDSTPLLTEKETATAWRLIEKYMRSKSQMDRELLLSYDRGISTLKNCSPIQIFGITVDTKQKEITNLSEIDILPYIEDMFVQDKRGLSYTFIYARKLTKEDGRVVSCFDEFLDRIERDRDVRIQITRRKVSDYLKDLGFKTVRLDVGTGMSINKEVYEGIRARKQYTLA